MVEDYKELNSLNNNFIQETKRKSGASYKSHRLGMVQTPSNQTPSQISQQTTDHEEIYDSVRSLS